MSVLQMKLNSRRRPARCATFAMILTSAAAAVSHAQAQDAQPQTTPTPPYVLFQDSTLTGSGSTVTASRLAVVLATGTIYEDVTMQFDVDAQGNLTVAPGYPQIVPSATPIVTHFRAGTYVGPSTILGGKATITVSGPGAGPGGTTEWTIAAQTGADPCTYPSSATWYVGPLANNPLASRLQKIGITFAGYSYGTGSSQCTNAFDWNNTSTLLGFSQVGNALTVYSYTYENSDSLTPVAQITYTRQP